jgi:hypothetical protein
MAEVEGKKVIRLDPGEILVVEIEGARVQLSLRDPDAGDQKSPKTIHVEVKQLPNTIGFSYIIFAEDGMTPRSRGSSAAPCATAPKVEQDPEPPS